MRVFEFIHPAHECLLYAVWCDDWQTVITTEAGALRAFTTREKAEEWIKQQEKRDA